MTQFNHAINMTKLQIYERDVMLKYQIFNGLFLGLPFADPLQAGSRLAIFSKICTDEMAKGKTAPQAVDYFLSVIPLAPSDHLRLLVKFLQFVERQVVLFDALEDAAFSHVHDMAGFGTVNYLLQQVHFDHQQYGKALQQLLTEYKTRIVLTAHPTQFYPPVILGIIGKLGLAIRDNDINEIRNLFLQMGLTRFNNQSKPTPLDEAASIIWYLENVFYKVLPLIQAKLPQAATNLELGFWPGGDRDGNPYVTAEITLQVATKLRNALLRLYYHDVQALRHRLTFDQVHELLGNIAAKLKQDAYIDFSQLVADLQLVVQLLEANYQGLFKDQVAEVILKVNLFKFYFAKLDIRQNSAIHKQVISHTLSVNKLCLNYAALSDELKLAALDSCWGQASLMQAGTESDQLSAEVFATIRAIQTLQQLNGYESIERYIISNTDSIASVYEVLWLVDLVNGDFSPDQQIVLAIVPLFETIEDLQQAEVVMERLFNLPRYKRNLQQLNKQQTIMLGFSDGTKDGGYLMANWSIFMAKKRLSQLAKRYAINLTFFDGRGGPPARGGGDTYLFYHSLAQEIDAHEIQLTIQGQTISANFGTIDSALFNVEHLLTSGISGRLFAAKNPPLSTQQEQLITQLAEFSLASYLELKHDPLFIAYLEEITPLHYLAEANIGSRPAKRNKGSQLRLEDLRAIPFGGAWMQMKQNILGYYGLGSALKQVIAANLASAEQLADLYAHSLLFKGLMDNAMQSLANTNFALTRHLEQDLKFGAFWQKIYHEASLSEQMLLQVSGQNKLIVDNPVKMQSVSFREQIILPLVIIQQYAMNQLRHLPPTDAQRQIYEKIIKKSLAASINASRNSI